VKSPAHSDLPEEEEMDIEDIDKGYNSYTVAKRLIKKKKKKVK